MKIFDDHGALLFEGRLADVMCVLVAEGGVAILRAQTKDDVAKMPTSELDGWRAHYERLGLGAMDVVSWLADELEYRRSIPYNHAHQSGR